MALFSISYDLVTPGQDYDALSQLGAKRALLSNWVVKRSDFTATTLREHITQYLDANDRLFVIEVEDWAIRNGMTKINDL